MSSEKLRKLELGITIVLVLGLSIYMSVNSNITGFFTLDMLMQNLDITLTQSQAYTITSLSDEPFILTSFKLSGEVIGDGMVEIYLDNGRGQQLLVYRNVKPVNTGIGLITGMFAGEQEDKGKEANYLRIKEGDAINADFIELSQDEETVNGTFSNECSEACFIKMELSKDSGYNLMFYIEQGTNLRIDEIYYTIKTNS